MSRYTKKVGNLTIAYGFDHMGFSPGYFFQVFDKTKEAEGNSEGMVINEGFLRGLPRSRMVELMTEYNVGTEEQWQKIALDLPI